jgi:hypothetical protein
MDTNYVAKVYNGIELSKTLPTLAANESLRAALVKEFGAAIAAEMAAMLDAGKFDGESGITLHDYLLDALINDYDIVWSGTTKGCDGDYPVYVSCRFGIYCVWALEYDTVGYFLTLDDAKSYIYGTWDDVSED